MKFCSRIIQYVLGLLILAFGVAFSANSGLGISPVNALPYVLSLVLKVELGMCVTGVFLLYTFLQILILRRDFQLINLTQILFSTLFGFFVDFAKAVLGSFSIPTYAGQLVMLAISIVLVATGISLYVDAALVNMPMEGLVSAIVAKQNKYAFHQIKVIVDCIVVLLAAILSLAALHDLQGVREGTLLCALLVGKIMPLIREKLLCRFK